MLCLKLRKHERIIIGPDIVVEFREFGRSQVTLGVTAPPDVSVWREDTEPGRELFLALIARTTETAHGKGTTQAETTPADGGPQDPRH